MSAASGAGYGAVRFARHTARLADCRTFYADLVGLPVVASFEPHDDDELRGVVFGLPDAAITFELVEAPQPEAPDRRDHLVLYFPGAAARDVVVDRLAAAGVAPVDQPPYWRQRGAVTVADPDGCPVVLAPWVFGVDPVPTVAD